MNVTEPVPENVSYLLVIFYQNVRSYGAGMLTVLYNRIGHVALQYFLLE